MKTNHRKKSNPRKYVNKFSRLSNSTKKINTLTSKRGGIKL